MPEKEKPFWNLRLVPTLRDAAVNPETGLSDAEAAARLKQFGPNAAVGISHAPLWLQFAQRFTNPLIILLLAASAISAVTGDAASFFIIIAMVILSVTLDFFQEMRAEKSVDALRRSVAVKVDVLRDGKTLSVPAMQIVPGDVVQLSAGTLVPADGRLIVCKDIYVNQALLTGESFPVEKISGDLQQPVEDVTEAINAVFMGTSIISGSGMMLVMQTGKDARLGKLAGALSHRHPPTAFEQGVQRFGMLILRITVLLVLFILLVNTLLHRPVLESFLFALALAVGLTPELLPMIMTITLSRGAMRMAARKVIVKHLPAMHNLGAADVLCTDKTGTLTEANIRLVKTIDARGAASEHVFLMAYLNSYFESGIKAPLDQAVLDYAAPDIGGWKKLDEIPFDFERRRVSVLMAEGERRLLIVKGAPEDILKLVTHIENESGVPQSFDEEKRAECMERFEALGRQGYRVLAIAFREVDASQETAMMENEAELTFAGFAVFLDPPKLDAAETLHMLAQDGIRVKVISGDNERVTRHVCEMIGFETGRVLTGGEMAELSDDALLALVDETHVFCRVTPQQKSRIIAVLKRRNHTVGFLGDGINDAPALHAADVGISVDSATDVAKEAADIILLEHDLSVIHGGVLEGRRAVLNTEKYILMGSSSNFGNMFSMAGAALFLPFLPMLPIQILLNNLLYDFSQTALPFDNVDAEALGKPVHWDMRRIRRFMGILGPVSSVFDFLTFYVLLAAFHANVAFFQTGWFVESIVTQVLIIFSIRTRQPMLRSRPHPSIIAMSLGIAALSMGLPFIPVIDSWFKFVSLPPVFFVFLAVALGVYFLLVEGIKHVLRRIFL